MKSRAFILVTILLLTYFSFAQKQANNWYFGSYAGLTFNSGKPLAVSKSAMLTYFGCASISSENGRLLFYSNGLGIWDSSHINFATGLVSNDLAIQSALIVPRPDSIHRYYIFTVSGSDWLSGYKGAAYSEINMKLRSGLGDIVNGTKNTFLVTPTSEKITAVKHANRRDYWVVTNKVGTDTIYSYLVTPSGVNHTPIKSKIGYKWKASGITRGYMKISPDGKKICSVAKSDSSIIADFDASSGKVSNVWVFYTNNVFAIEFSAKSKYMYTIDNIGPNKLFQYDMDSKTKATFLASRKTIDSGSYKVEVTSMQLAPDAKIYINPYGSGYLDVLHFPDMEGKKAGFQRNYAYLGGKTTFYGLPDFIQSIFHKPSFKVRQNCARDSVVFTISNTYDLDSAHWNFGDTISGINNSSKLTSNVFHYYQNPGLYTVRLVSYHKAFIDTIYESFEVYAAKPYLGKDTAICNSKKISIQPKGTFVKYKWFNGNTSNSISVNQMGTYFLTVTAEDGCGSSDTINVKNAIVSADYIITDSALCFKSNQFTFKLSSTYTNDFAKQTNWVFSDSTFTNDSLITKSFNKPGTFSIRLISEGRSGCMDTMTKTVRVYENTSVDFTINNPNQCLNTHSFNFVNSSINVSDSLSFEWDLGDIKTTQHDFIGKKYSQTGNFMISLISISENNCKDTIAKSISILPSPKAEFFWGGACSRKNIQFTFAGNVPALPVTTNYKWYFPNKDSSDLKNPSKLLNQPGINNVTLVTKSDNGCESSITRDVEVLPQAKADFETKDVCEDSAVFFNNTSQDGITYSWKFGDGKSSNLKSPQHQYTIAGISRSFNVNLIAFVPGGCSDSITKAVTVNANPNSDFTFSISGRLVNFTASELTATQYKWNFGDGSTFNSTTPKTSYHYTKFPFGKYPTCLTVTNVANCISETCKEVNITGAVNSISKQSGIKIYPNPNSGIFSIDILEPKENPTLELINQLGQIVYKVELIQASNNLDLNLANGFYLVKVLDGNSIYTQKMIIHK